MFKIENSNCADPKNQTKPISAKELNEILTATSLSSINTIFVKLNITNLKNLCSNVFTRRYCHSIALIRNDLIINFDFDSL